jgi:predicted PurR-regulated permease PerM
MITGGIEVLLLSLALLFNFLGLAALAGAALIVATAPLNAWLQRRMKRLQSRIMQRCVLVCVGVSGVMWLGAESRIIQRCVLVCVGVNGVHCTHVVGE